MEIPLIAPYFNQPTYLRNLVNWWRWYRPDDPVYVLDNASDKIPTLDHSRVEIVRCQENKGWQNMTQFLKDRINSAFEYYVISDPDIMPHPTTPPDFVEVLHYCIEKLGYHHAGFGLIFDDIPDWVAPNMKSEYQRHEASLLNNPVSFQYGDRTISGWKAPIDTTFAMYSTKNSGWSSPMPGPEWDNSIRIFRAFHLGFYLTPRPNDEMCHYFNTAVGPLHMDGGSAFRNHCRPGMFNDRFNRLWQEDHDRRFGPAKT